MTKKRRIGLVLLLGIATMCVVAGWFFFPWPDKTYRVWNGATFNRVTEERRFRFISKDGPETILGPDREKSFVIQTVQFSGPTWGTSTVYRFGFFEMSDVTFITAE